MDWEREYDAFVGVSVGNGKQRGCGDWPQLGESVILLLAERGISAGFQPLTRQNPRPHIVQDLPFWHLITHTRPSTMSDSSTAPKCCSNLAPAYAHLLLRLWIGMRLFMAGVDKFRWGNGETTTFSFSNYTELKAPPIAKLMASNSFLPEAMCNAFANSIGYVLLVVGVWTALGIFTELGLLAAGAVFLMLGFGLACLPDDTELVGNIGVSVAIVALALMTAHAKKFSLDGILGKKKAE
jgi:uncharacterized membrane protein YphA (DoxX/SURF4 family)